MTLNLIHVGFRYYELRQGWANVRIAFGSWPFPGIFLVSSPAWEQVWNQSMQSGRGVVAYYQSFCILLHAYLLIANYFKTSKSRSRESHIQTQPIQYRAPDVHVNMVAERLCFYGEGSIYHELKSLSWINVCPRWCGSNDPEIWKLELP